MGGGRWQAKEWNPARQASDGSQRLMSFFTSQGIGGINVQPRVVWAGSGRVELVGSPRVLIWFLSDGSLSWIKRDLEGGGSRLRANDLAKLDLALS